MPRKVRNPIPCPFKKGDRVTLNDRWFTWNGDQYYQGPRAQLDLFEWQKVSNRVWKRGVQATVVGFSRVDRPCVYLVADGHPTRSCFHPDFLALL